MRDSDLFREEVLAALEPRGLDDEGRGWELIDYSGRNFYKGPAVVVPSDEFQAVVRVTTMELVWDNMGKHDIVVYPRYR